MKIEKIIFPSEEGIFLEGLMHLPEPSQDRRAAVIICHGMLSDKSSEKHEKLCVAFARAGLHAFRFDFRCSGESGARNLLGPEYITLSDELIDLTAAMRVVQRRVAPVALVGSSFGGAVALLFAAENPYVFAVATMAAVGRPLDLFRRLAGDKALEEWKQKKSIEMEGVKFGYRLYEDAASHDVLAACAKISCPLLAIHGDRDEVVSVEDARAIVAAFAGKAELEIIEGADHCFEKADHRKLMIDRIYDFIVSKT